MELLSHYKPGHGMDEAAAPGQIREQYRPIVEALAGQEREALLRRQRAADLFFLNRGTTFTVYQENAGIDRIFPFDSFPRIIPAAEWTLLERGLKQRLHALNLFLHDLYHDQKILK